MATLFKVATTLGPAVFSGLSHEWDVMKQDPTPLSLKRVGHGFKAFGFYNIFCFFSCLLVRRQPHSPLVAQR